MFLKKTLVITTIALALMLPACSGVIETVETPKTATKPAIDDDPSTPTLDPINLDGTEWVLASLHGGDLVSDSIVTLAFPEGNYLQGSAGCNYYGARYTSRGSDLDLAQGLDKTDFDCDLPQSARQQEAAYFEALANAASYRATADRLEIKDASGATILVFAIKEEPSLDPTLDGTEWVLTSLNGGGLVQDSHVTVGFAQGSVSGFAGCNSFGGDYAAADQGILALPEIAMTDMDCPGAEAIMEQEADFVKALQNAAAYQLLDDRLEVANASGETILVFARQEAFSMDPSALIDTAWQLVSWDGNSPIEGSIITLVFHDEVRVSGSAGCGGYVATYEATDDDIGFPMFGMTGPFKGCSEEMALQEGEYTTNLGWASDYRLRDGQLEILTARGGVLVFDPLPEGNDASLEGTTWALTALVEERTVEGMDTPALMPATLLPGTRITAKFENGTVNGSAGCNTYSAAYTLDDSSLGFDVVAATEMACPDPQGVMEQEQRYLGLLGDVTTYSIAGDQLWLETGDGWTLVLTADGR